MIETVIVEDEKRTLNFLKAMLSQYCPDVKQMGEASSVKSARELILKVNPFLVFLDIEMPDGNAFDLLESFPSCKFHVIFITAYDNYAIQAIKFSAFDYLLKPINFIELKKAVDKLRERQINDFATANIKMWMNNFPLGEKSLDKIAIPSIDGHLFIDVNEIIRLEANDNYTYIYLASKNKIIASRTLKDFENLLDKYEFIRVHHSHIVNLHHVKQYVKGDGGYIILNDNTKIDVSRRKKEEFLRRMSVR